MDDKQKLVEKVLKLFSLGDKSRNLSEAEAEAAATKARQLMLEHQLSEVDLETYGTAKAKKLVWIIREHTAYTLRRPFAAYDGWVAVAVMAITDTESLIHTRYDEHGKKFYRRTFVGAEADVAVASELFLILLEQLRRSAREKYGPGWGRVHVDYGNGWAVRIMERARAAHLPDQQLTEGQAQTMALVLRDKKSAVDSHIAQTYKLKKARARQLRNYTTAFHEGYQDGNTVDLGDPKRRIG